VDGFAGSGWFGRSDLSGWWDLGSGAVGRGAPRLSQRVEATCDSCGEVAVVRKFQGRRGARLYRGGRQGNWSVNDRGDG
jgi:predicted RNA-binding Zn-ribbon protein involved in translation (DUF1610 family)